MTLSSSFQDILLFNQEMIEVDTFEIKRKKIYTHTKTDTHMYVLHAMYMVEV